MDFGLPEIAPEECTPLVQRLLEVIQHQQQLLQQLRDEVARLKGLSPRPPLAPSRLEQPPPPSPPGPGHKRPGSAKRPKNALLVIHEEVTLAVPDRSRPNTFMVAKVTLSVSCSDATASITAWMPGTPRPLPSWSA